MTNFSGNFNCSIPGGVDLTRNEKLYCYDLTQDFINRKFDNEY